MKWVFNSCWYIYISGGGWLGGWRCWGKVCGQSVQNSSVNECRKSIFWNLCINVSCWALYHLLYSRTYFDCNTVTDEEMKTHVRKLKSDFCVPQMLKLNFLPVYTHDYKKKPTHFYHHQTYFWIKYDLGQKYYTPQVWPDRGSNSWPPDDDSSFHVTKTLTLTISDFFCHPHIAFNNSGTERTQWPHVLQILLFSSVIEFLQCIYVLFLVYNEWDRRTVRTEFDPTRVQNHNLWIIDRTSCPQDTLDI